MDTMASKRTHRLALLVGLCICMALLAACAGATSAFAKSYDISNDDINATVDTSGNIHVVENRTFSFSGDYTAVWWLFNTSNDSGYNATYTVTGVSVDGKALPYAQFQSSWRDTGGPSSSAYSIDTGLSGQYGVYVFSNWASTDSTVRIEYTVNGLVKDWADTGELYWQFIGSKWDVKTDKVSMTLALPVPTGEIVSAGNNVRVWGHGPLNGNVGVNADGTIGYSVTGLPANTFVESRVTFPSSWLSGMSQSSQSNLDNILSAEQSYADSSNAQRVGTRVRIGLVWGACILLVLFCFIYFMKYGREHKVDFKDKYWREPFKGYHPAVIGRLWRWNKESTIDLTATLMDLTRRGCLQLEKTTYLSKHNKEKDDYRLTRFPDRCAQLTDPIDQAVVKLVFDTCAGGEDTVLFHEISQAGKMDAEGFASAMEGFQGEVTAEVNAADLFEAKGDSAKTWMKFLAILLVIVALCTLVFAETFTYLAPMLIAALVIYIIGRNMSRRNKTASELYAKCEAMKNWFEDFTILDERLPTDVAVWGEYLVYAHIFGVADKVIKALQVKEPTLYNDIGFQSMCIWYYPVMFGRGTAFPADTFDNVVSNTMSTVSSAMSNNSSGGGFGGGFSGGGGFGGGGGGGGAR